ncbi:MAG: hypothetical protein ACOX1V_04355 [Candidatus Iainarchaeum sp.]|jgi:hypothetical protein|nr:MAG: hypothetical protein BWY55_00841 [archaeon ADurb.Bin336]
MKITKWALIIVTFAIIIWLLFNLEIWAREWKDLFFYQDNWILFVALFVFLVVAKKIASWVLVTQLKVMK